MREYGLTSRQPVKHHYRVNEDKSPPLPNLLNRQFNPAAPNRVWCGDIIFIHLQDKWCYLALVVDLYSRRIIGSALSLTADAELVCRALRNALETRPRDGRLLFHSDQGVQYKSNKYRKLLWRYGVMQSMSRRGNCLDNSPMERVFHSLKSEWLPKGDYGDFSHAVRDINQWINGFTTFIDLTRTTMVYRLAYMKKSGNRLSRCPDFVIHYSPSDRYKLYQVDGKLDDLQPAPAS